MRRIRLRGPSIIGRWRCVIRRMRVRGIKPSREASMPIIREFKGFVMELARALGVNILLKQVLMN
jgi:hypothetical protein